MVRPLRARGRVAAVDGRGVVVGPAVAPAGRFRSGVGHGCRIATAWAAGSVRARSCCPAGPAGAAGAGASYAGAPRPSYAAGRPIPRPPTSSAYGARWCGASRRRRGPCCDRGAGAGGRCRRGGAPFPRHRHPGRRLRYCRGRHRNRGHRQIRSRFRGRRQNRGRPRSRNHARPRYSRARLRSRSRSYRQRPARPACGRACEPRHRDVPSHHPARPIRRPAHRHPIRASRLSRSSGDQPWRSFPRRATHCPTRSCSSACAGWRLPPWP